MTVQTVKDRIEFIHYVWRNEKNRSNRRIPSFETLSKPYEGVEGREMALRPVRC